MGGGGETEVKVRLAYKKSTDEEYTMVEADLGAGSTWSKTVNGLQNGTLYDVRAVLTFVRNEVDYTFYSDPVRQITIDGPPPE